MFRFVFCFFFPVRNKLSVKNVTVAASNLGINVKILTIFFFIIIVCQNLKACTE